MNTEVGTKPSKDFENDFFNLMNNSVLIKTMKNVEKHKDIKLLTTKGRRSHLVAQSNYHTQKKGF